MQFRVINAVGVELEGAWLPGRNMDGATHHRDGSVRMESMRESVQSGEYVSPKMTTPAEVAAWVEKHYPDFVNSTCGLHVHLSFRHIKWRGFALERAFYDAFLERMKVLGAELDLPSEHRFWGRLKGVEYAHRMWKPDKQIHIIDTHHDRYTHLNYAFAKHGTVENRLFPCFVKPSVGTKAVMSYIGWVEDYMKKRRLEPEMDIGGAFTPAAPAADSRIVALV